jgi:glycine C-acetyltransferase
MVYSSKNIFQNQIDEIKNSGLYKDEWQITSSQSTNIDVLDDQNNEKNILNLCANNYLGLSNNKKIIEAAQSSLSDKGYGCPQ